MNKEITTKSKITETDVVSGRLYLKLIKDFKEHEAQLKELILGQRDKIMQLKELINAVGKEDSKEMAIINLKQKLEHFKKLNMEKSKVISNLKRENERIFSENVRLKEQLKKYQ